MTTLGNQLAIVTVRMKQVERQIANPLAVEGLVPTTNTPALGVPRGWLQTMHGIDFKTPPMRKLRWGIPDMNALACRTGSIAWWL